jgi:hypothetical protein
VVQIAGSRNKRYASELPQAADLAESEALRDVL